MNIRIVTKTITRAEAKEIGKEFYTSMVKGVVDIENKTIALGGEWHMDANIALVEKGSRQNNIWGFNFYFDKAPEDCIEYISLINVRPADGNDDMMIQSELLQQKMKKIIEKLII